MLDLTQRLNNIMRAIISTGTTHWRRANPIQPNSPQPATAKLSNAKDMWVCVFVCVCVCCGCVVVVCFFFWGCVGGDAGGVEREGHAGVIRPFSGVTNI